MLPVKSAQKFVLQSKTFDVAYSDRGNTEEKPIWNLAPEATPNLLKFVDDSRRRYGVVQCDPIG
jgi:hypothetical protein